MLVACSYKGIVLYQSAILFYLLTYSITDILPHSTNYARQFFCTFCLVQSNEQPQKICFSVLSVYNIKYARTRAWVNCATRQVLSFRKLQDSTQPRRASHSRTHKTVLICALSCTTFYTIFLVQPFQESCKLCHKTATNFRRYSWNAALTGFNPLSTTRFLY